MKSNARTQVETYKIICNSTLYLFILCNILTRINTMILQFKLKVVIKFVMQIEIINIIAR